MADRRTEILDTALTVLAEHGMRGLTHRAIDAAAALPQGSTSYYFRTRDALVTACVRRLLDLDVTDLPAAPPTDTDAVADLAARMCVQFAITDVRRTRARYELTLQAVRSPEVHAALVEAGDELRRLATALVAATGVSSPEEAAHGLMALMEGLVFTAVVRGPHDPDELFAHAGVLLRRLLSTYS